MVELSAALVDKVATRYGISIDSQADRQQYRETIERIAQRTEVERRPAPADSPPRLRAGTDAYNAFRRRFELAPTDDGPLTEHSLAVKDNIAVAGVELTCGSAGFTYTPAATAPVVTRLRAGGGRIIGTTNMDEFGYTPTGETCAHTQVSNPTVDGHIPGGSSSGSAAAVAGGLVDAALGTDTAGSVRTPAACCGIVGYKPSRGLIPQESVVPLAPSLDHVGALAPDVETAAKTVSAAAGESDHNNPAAGLRSASSPTARLGAGVTDLRVGVPTPPLRRASEPVRDAVETARDTLRAQGVTVTSCSMPDLDRAVDAAQTIIGTEFATLVAQGGVLYGTDTPVPPRLQAAFRALPDATGIGEHIARQLLYNGVLADQFAGQRYAAAQATRQSLQAALHEQFAEFDALLLPTLLTQTPPLGSVDGMAEVRRLLATTAPANLTGMPALSIPWPADDQPIGLQVVADYAEDQTACSLAQTIEAVKPT